jgi:hypothetical protein
VFLLLSMYVYSYCSSMYSYCCLCILIVAYVRVFLLFVHVFLTLSTYSYCCLCILIVVYVFLLLSMCSYYFLCTCTFLLFFHVFLTLSIYSYCFLCILIVVYVFLLFVHVFLSLLMYTLDAATLTEVFPCFFLSCKATARVKLAKTVHGLHSPLLCCSTVVLFYLLIDLYRSMYCLCVNVYYCHRVTTQLQLTNISYIISYHIKIEKNMRI